MIHVKKFTFEEKLTRAPKSRGYFAIDKFRVSPSNEQAAVMDGLWEFGWLEKSWLKNLFPNWNGQAVAKLWFCCQCSIWRVKPYLWLWLKELLGDIWTHAMNFWTRSVFQCKGKWHLGAALAWGGAVISLAFGQSLPWDQNLFSAIKNKGIWCLACRDGSTLHCCGGTLGAIWSAN